MDDPVLAEIVRGAGDAVIVADPDGAIAYWNAAAEAMFGRSADEAVGASLDVVVPEGLRQRHWEGFRHTMATGETKYGGQTVAGAAGGGRRGRAHLGRVHRRAAARRDRRRLGHRGDHARRDGGLGGAARAGAPRPRARVRARGAAPITPPAPRPAGGEEFAGRGARGREGPAAT